MDLIFYGKLPKMTIDEPQASDLKIRGPGEQMGKKREKERREEKEEEKRSQTTIKQVA